jgi:hypothetical protein
MHRQGHIGGTQQARQERKPPDQNDQTGQKEKQRNNPPERAAAGRFGHGVTGRGKWPPLIHEIPRRWRADNAEKNDHIFFQYLTKSQSLSRESQKGKESLLRPESYRSASFSRGTPSIL